MYRRGAVYFAAALLALSIVYVGGRSLSQGSGNDASVFYYGTRLLLRGENPYEPAAMQAEWAATREEGSTRPSPQQFVNPPIVGVLIAPVALFPIETALRLFTLLNFFCLLASVYFLDRMLSEKAPPALRLLLATWVVMLPPAMKAFSYGQSTLLICAPAAVGLYCLRRKREGWAGFWLALSLAKFTITLPFLAVLVLRGRWKAAGVSLAVFSAINLALVLPVGLVTMLTSYRSAIESFERVDGMNDPFSALATEPHNIVSVTRLFMLILGHDRAAVGLAVLILTVVLAPALMLLVRWRPAPRPALENPLEIALSIMSGLALMYHRVYDLAALMFVIYALVEYRLRHPGRQPVAWKLATGTLFVLSFFVVGAGWSRPFDFVLSKLHLPPSPEFGSILVFALLLQVAIMMVVDASRRSSWHPRVE
jgi:hypothetical protein